MRQIRNLAVFCLLLLSSTAFAASSAKANTLPALDGGDPPPTCLPSDPNCKP